MKIVEMKKRGVEVYTYGSANENGTPLATVRRNKTSFFHSGGLDHEKKYGDRERLGVCTVGSPGEFVENFNLRLTPCITRKQASALARYVRERDGGIMGVEALTLPYSEGRYEVACNLLKPSLGGKEDMLAKFDANG